MIVPYKGAYHWEGRNDPYSVQGHSPSRNELCILIHVTDWLRMPYLRQRMDWRQHISSDPEVLMGKATIKGTRISVEFLIDLLADG